MAWASSDLSPYPSLSLPLPIVSEDPVQIKLSLCEDRMPIEWEDDRQKKSATLTTMLSFLLGRAHQEQESTRELAIGTFRGNAVLTSSADINHTHHPYALIRPLKANPTPGQLVNIHNTTSLTPRLLYLPEQMRRWLGCGSTDAVEMLPLSADDSRLRPIASILLEVDLESVLCSSSALMADALSRDVRAEFANLAVNKGQTLLYAVKEKVVEGRKRSFVDAFLSTAHPTSTRTPTLLSLKVLELQHRPAEGAEGSKLGEAMYGALKDDSHIKFTLAEGSRLRLAGGIVRPKRTTTAPATAAEKPENRSDSAKVSESSPNFIDHAAKKAGKDELDSKSKTSEPAAATPETEKKDEKITLELMSESDISSASLYHLSERLSRIYNCTKGHCVITNPEDYDVKTRGRYVTLSVAPPSRIATQAEEASGHADSEKEEGEEEEEAKVIHTVVGNNRRVPKGKLGLHPKYCELLFGSVEGGDEATVHLSQFANAEADVAIYEIEVEINAGKSPDTPGCVTYVNVDSAKRAFLEKHTDSFLHCGEQVKILYKDELPEESLCDRDDGAVGASGAGAKRKRSLYSSGQAKEHSVSGQVIRIKLASTSANSETEASFGLLKATSDVRIIVAKGTDVELFSRDQGEVELLGDSWDFQSMGIGGLDSAVADIFRRAFASRLCSRMVVEKLGLNHVRGILLHGPPGTGKTLIARKLAERLHSRPPKIVNGPEVFSRWMGKSEEHIRNLFEDAEREYRAVGDKSRQHVIIFDEFDAIAPNRATMGTECSRTNHKVVNQLLSKIDGVHKLDNILLICMTNQSELIDPAMLRPGRVEIQLEIALPDEAGRRQILQIHTEPMRINDMLDADVNLDQVAKRAVNYSGAELEGLVRAAQSLVLERLLKMNKKDTKCVKMTMADFELALKKDVKPAFGSSIEDLQLCLPHGIIPWHEDIQSALDRGAELVQQCRSSAGGFARLLLVGERRAGTTALAAQIAIASNMPFIRMVTPHSLSNRVKRGAMLQTVFDDAYKSPESCVILDNFECLVGLSPGSEQWDVDISQKIQLLLEKRPPEGKKLFIIVTSSSDTFVKHVQLHSSFSTICKVPSINSKKHLMSVATGCGVFAVEELEEMSQTIGELPSNFELGIKKLFELIDFAVQAPEGERVKALAKQLEESQSERRIDLRYLNIYA